MLYRCKNCFNNKREPIDMHNKKPAYVHSFLYELFRKLMNLLLPVVLLIPVSCHSPAPGPSVLEPVAVSLVEKDDRYYLVRDGEPYYIYGAGGQMYMDLVKPHGGNSIRLWSTNSHSQESGMSISAILDSALTYGLTVTLGLWVTHPRHNRDFYGDSTLIRKQLERFRNDVELYRDHPALLMWAVGNEVHLGSDDLRVWDAVGDIAEMIKQEDPRHPVATVTAGISGDVVKAIHTRAPEIDLIGVNMYNNDLSYLPGKVREAGWDKAYFVGEYGPHGPWMVKQTPWGGRLEPLQEEKLNAYIRGFGAFLQDSLRCVGSYAFKWGWKWEKTYSWFNMFNHEGKEVVTMDALQYAWTGKWPDNRSPVSGQILIDGKSADEPVVLLAGMTSTARVSVWDRENDTLHFDWVVYPESTSKARGGDPEIPEIPVEGVTGEKKENTVTLNAPGSEGAYRLYVFVNDKNERVSISNIPFYVKSR
jgi:hypothetical protein